MIKLHPMMSLTAKLIKVTLIIIINYLDLKNYFYFSLNLRWFVVNFEFNVNF